MLGGEADVGPRAISRSGSSPASAAASCGAEALEPVERERVEQVLLVGEVPAGRAVADARPCARARAGTARRRRRASARRASSNAARRLPW